MLQACSLGGSRGLEVEGIWGERVAGRRCVNLSHGCCWPHVVDGVRCGGESRYFRGMVGKLDRCTDRLLSGSVSHQGSTELKLSWYIAASRHESMYRRGIFLSGSDGGICICAWS